MWYNLIVAPATKHIYNIYISLKWGVLSHLYLRTGLDNLHFASKNQCLDPLLVLSEKSHLLGCLRITMDSLPPAWGFLSRGASPSHHGGWNLGRFKFLSHGHPWLDDLGDSVQETSISLLITSSWFSYIGTSFIPIQSTSMSCSLHSNPKSTLPGSPSLIKRPCLVEAMAWQFTVKQRSPGKKKSSSGYNLLFLKLTTPMLRVWIPNIGWQELGLFSHHQDHKVWWMKNHGNGTKWGMVTQHSPRKSEKFNRHELCISSPTHPLQVTSLHHDFRWRSLDLLKSSGCF